MISDWLAVFIGRQDTWVLDEAMTSWHVEWQITLQANKAETLGLPNGCQCTIFSPRIGCLNEQPVTLVHFTTCSLQAVHTDWIICFIFSPRIGCALIKNLVHFTTCSLHKYTLAARLLYLWKFYSIFFSVLPYWQSISNPFISWNQGWKSGSGLHAVLWRRRQNVYEA